MVAPPTPNGASSSSPPAVEPRVAHKHEPARSLEQSDELPGGAEPEPLAVPEPALPELEEDAVAPSDELAGKSPWRSYKETLSNLSRRIVDLQRGMSILPLLRWDDGVEDAFRASRGRELPRVNREWWTKLELEFEPRTRIEEFEEIARDVKRELGDNDPFAPILVATVLEYRDVVHLLTARGTRGFYRRSRALWGSPKDALPGWDMCVRDVGFALYDALAKVASSPELAPDGSNMSAEDAAEVLRTRFDRVFGPSVVDVMVDGDLLADASAVGDRVKLRQGAKFCMQELDVLEVHEGWVHIATTLNGLAQPVARWLAKGPPRTTTTQEGIAVLTEIFTGRSYVQRARKLNDRLLAIDKAEDGASFLDVYEWYRTEGYDEDECFSHTRRVFRGGVLQGGAPFTKDISYAKGLVLCFDFLQEAVLAGRLDHVPMLFAGKVAHEDVAVLAEHVADGMVRPPRFLPPPFRDPRGLAVWLAYSSLLKRRCAAGR